MTTLQEARRRLQLHAPATRIATTADPGALSYYLVGGATLLLLVIGVVMVLSASTITSIRLNDGNPYANFLSQGQFVLIGLPILVLVFIATTMIRHVPLRETLEDAPAEQG